MTKHQFGTIGCRLLSLYFLTNALVSFSSPVAMMSMIFQQTFSSPNMFGAGFPFLVQSLVPAVFQILAALILWSFAPTIARKMYPVDDPID